METIHSRLAAIEDAMRRDDGNFRRPNMVEIVRRVVSALHLANEDLEPTRKAYRETCFSYPFDPSPYMRPHRWAESNSLRDPSTCPPINLETLPLILSLENIARAECAPAIVPASILPPEARKEIQLSTDKKIDDTTSILVSLERASQHDNDDDGGNDESPAVRAYRMRWGAQLSRNPWENGKWRPLSEDEIENKLRLATDRAVMILSKSANDEDIGDPDFTLSGTTYANAPRFLAYLQAACVILRMGLTVKGGFVRDVVIHGDEPNDIDVIVPLDRDLQEVERQFLCDILPLGLTKFKGYVTENIISCSVINHAQTYVVECQFIHVNRGLRMEADLTSNTLALHQIQSLHVYGTSSLSFDKIFRMCASRQFGVQSGFLVPRVRQRAEALVERGWKRVKVDPVPERESMMTEDET